MDPMGIAQRAKNQRLRRELLTALHASRGERAGEVTAALMARLFGPASVADEPADSDDQVVLLLDDLVAKGYAAKRDSRQYQWQPRKLGQLWYRITARGISLAEQTIEPDPDIEDDRIPSNQ